MPHYEVILAGNTKKDDIVIIERNLDAMVALGDRVLVSDTEYRVFNIVHDLGRNVSQIFVMR